MDMYDDMYDYSPRELSYFEMQTLDEIKRLPSLEDGETFRARAIMILPTDRVWEDDNTLTMEIIGVERRLDGNYVATKKLCVCSKLFGCIYEHEYPGGKLINCVNGSGLITISFNERDMEYTHRGYSSFSFDPVLVSLKSET